MRAFRLALVVTALAGCLGEPARPTQAIHHAVEVADLDGDHYDDVVVWGHDGDNPTGQLWIFWGGNASGLLGPTVVPLTASAATVDSASIVWTEPLAVTVSADASPPELLVLTGEDTALPPAGKSSRHVFLDRYAVHGRDAIARTASSGPAALAIGGYADTPPTVFVVDRPADGSDAPGEILAGDGPLVVRVVREFANGTTLTPVTDGFVSDQAAVPAGTEQGLFAEPRGSGDTYTAALDVSTSGVFSTYRASDGGRSTLTAGVALPIQTSRLARAHAVGGKLYAVATEVGTRNLYAITVDTGGDPTFVTFMPSGSEHQTSDLEDIGTSDFDGDGIPEVVTIEDSLPRAYSKVTMAGPDITFTDAVRDDFDPRYDLMAIGNFQLGATEEIEFFSTQDVSLPASCYFLSFHDGAPESCSASPDH